MANRIPRNAKKLECTTLVDTIACKEGTTYKAEKTENGWIANINGKVYSLFLAFLRDSNCCNIKIIKEESL